MAGPLQPPLNFAEFGAPDSPVIVLTTPRPMPLALPRPLPILDISTRSTTPDVCLYVTKLELIIMIIKVIYLIILLLLTIHIECSVTSCKLICVSADCSRGCGCSWWLPWLYDHICYGYNGFGADVIS